MEYYYELIQTDIGIPINMFIHSVDKLQMHWHKHMEILLVLEGSINIRIGENKYLLKENDIVLINTNEVHSTSKTHENNVLLALQIDAQHYDRYFHGFSKRVFQCKSFMYSQEDQERFDFIRHQLAKIVWDLNKRKQGHAFTIGAELLLFAEHLLNNFPNEVLSQDKLDKMDTDISRIGGIVAYIDENIEKGVTLQDIADREDLNVYYLSHYIKKALGISFQEYLNIVRLERAVVLLARTDKTITDVAFESGFPSTKALNNLFRNEYDCTPTEFRKENKNKAKYIYDLKPDTKGVRSKSYFDVDRNTALSKLFTYLDLSREKVESISQDPSEVININPTKQGVKHNYYWKKLTTFGRAAEGLRKGWQDQLRELQREIGFEYIRFHGIFSDEMMIYNYNEKGETVYNWSYVDELFDFFKEVNIKPFIELGFMPSEIKSSDETIFWWKANISQPKDINLWTDLVREFIKHCINRYGLKEVETWYFEVWNEPELEYVFWIGGKEEYFEFYKETVLTIKSISNKLKVGGPSITHQAVKDGTWIEDFLTFCNEENLPLDFISTHIYPEDFSSDEDVEDFSEELAKGMDELEMISRFISMKKIYYDENHTYHTLTSINEKIENILPNKPEIHVTEWSASAGGRNLISDTSFVATFIIKNVLQSIDQVDSLGYWTFTDIMEEFKAGISHFHGGFGLFNKDGLKKSGYFAYYLLSKLGEEIIDQGKEHIATKTDDNIQVLAYNFTYFDELFMSGDTSALKNENRYLVYEEKASRAVKVNFEGLFGRYKVTRYKLNREHGSVFDQWVHMGGNENMTEEEIQYLKGISKPKMTVDYIDIEGQYREYLNIPIHGAELIVLEKQL